MFNEYHTWNVAASCHSVCVVQFVRQERLMCNCICMNTRLCLYSELLIWIARFYQAASLYLYCISVQSVLLRRGLQDKSSQEGATSRPKKKWAYQFYHCDFIWSVQTLCRYNQLEPSIQVTNSWGRADEILAECVRRWLMRWSEVFT